MLDKTKGQEVPARKSRTSTVVPIAKAAVTKFTYALSGWTAEIRADGWYVGATTSSFAGEKVKWTGPFETIETACLAIARRHAVEIADRHTRSIEHHKIKAKDSLYGLKPTTKL